MERDVTTWTQFVATYTFEREAAWDGDWLARNPEVAGWNTVPATNGSGLDDAERPPVQTGGRSEAFE